MRMHRWFVTAIVLAVLTVFTPATAKRFASVANPSSASLAAGFAHSLALTPDGVLWSWGDNTSGQLGDGTRATRTTPVRVAVFQATPVAVAAGGAHSLALGGDGVVWAWGLNDAGQVGDGGTVPQLRPTRVAGLAQAVSVAAGTRHSLAVRADGVVVAWGANDSGQLGDGTTRHRPTPAVVPGLSSAVAAAAGSGHSLAVTSDGTLWAWGDNTAGQLGDGTRHERRRPIRVAMSERAGAIAAGALHSLVVGASGAVYAFGANLTGQLGDGTRVMRLRPVRVRNVSAAIGVSAGVTHSVAVTTAGGLWTWGGLSTTPRAVASPPGVRAAAAGGAHNLVLTDEGAVWTQGINLSGQLGDGTRGSRADFVPISGPDQAWGVYPPMFSPGAGIYDAHADHQGVDADAWRDDSLHDRRHEPDRDRPTGPIRQHGSDRSHDAAQSARVPKRSRTECGHRSAVCARRVESGGHAGGRSVHHAPARRPRDGHCRRGDHLHPGRQRADAGLNGVRGTCSDCGKRDTARSWVSGRVERQRRHHCRVHV